MTKWAAAQAKTWGIAMLLVLGSINIDLTTVADEIPGVGETVIGKSFNQYPGGKGANQAVCAARLESEVCFLGKVGSDAYGEFMLREMERSGVDVSRIETTDVSTGVAAISVDAKGQNSIIVVPGANFCVDCAYIDRNSDAIGRCDIILAQHETPIDATERAFTLAKGLGKTTVLNPAPAMRLSDAMIALTDILVPNEYELARLTGMKCQTLAEISQAAHALIAKGVKSTIVTMGAQGVMLVDGETEQVFPAFRVAPVDTTAAGDSFLGGFAAEYMKTGDMAQSIANGQIVASYSIQHEGAQSSMPSYSQFMDYKRGITLNHPAAARHPSIEGNL